MKKKKDRQFARENTILLKRELLQIVLKILDVESNSSEKRIIYDTRTNKLQHFYFVHEQIDHEVNLLLALFLGFTVLVMGIVSYFISANVLIEQHGVVSYFSIFYFVSLSATLLFHYYRLTPSDSISSVIQKEENLNMEIIEANNCLLATENLYHHKRGVLSYIKRLIPHAIIQIIIGLFNIILGQPHLNISQYSLNIFLVLSILNIFFFLYLQIREYWISKEEAQSEINQLNDELQRIKKVLQGIENDVEKLESE